MTRNTCSGWEPVNCETALENLCLSCPTCNPFESDRVLAIDPETGEETALFHPHQHRWIDHFALNDDATEMVGLSPTGRATIAALKMNRPQKNRVRRMWVAMKEHPPDLDG